MDISRITSGLNPAQKKAVEAIDGPFLVVAGAGSGKTTVLSRRVAALIEVGIDPSSILLLTFTRVAAANMVERAKRLVPAASEVAGGTFHSIAHRLILENHMVFRLPDQPTFLDPDDVKSAFKKIAADLGDKKENFPSGAILAKAYSFAVNTQRDLDDVVYDKHPDFSHMIEFFQKCAEEYRAYKRERGMLDYDDLLVIWDKMLDHPVVGQKIRDRFRYVMVDEDQDCNAIQASIVKKLGPNIMVVGDPAQSIYAFRGSSPGTMFAFQQDFPDAELINLDTNYRSTEEILSVANAVDHAMFQRFDRTLQPAPGAGGETPKLVNVVDHNAEAKYIVDRILERKADGVELHEQAILVRSVHAGRHLEAELVRRHVPYKVSGGIRINEAAHIKDLMCLVRAAVNPLDEPAWQRVLTMAKGLGPKKASTVYQKIANRLKDDLFADIPTLIGNECKKNPDVTPIMDAYRILRQGGPVLETLERSIKPLDELFQKRYDDWRSRKSDINQVIWMADSHETLESFLSTMSLDYSVDKKATPVGDEDSERPITLSTVHSAKGLEWDVVYIPSFYDGHMPSAFGREHEELEEEKRVLYVAVTRPRKVLEIVRPTFGWARDGRPPMLVQASPFERLIEDYVEPVRIGNHHVPRQSYNLGFSEDVYIDVFG